MSSDEQIILPLGSIVHVKGGTEEQRLMIVARGSLTEVDGTTGYFDYAAVSCPEGLVDASQMLFFNREDVKDVVFVGFRDAREQFFAEHYDQVVSATPYPKLHVTREDDHE